MTLMLLTQTSAASSKNFTPALNVGERNCVGQLRERRLKVNANREYFEMGVCDMAQAESEYPGWLARLLTHPVRGLENYKELFEKLTGARGAIKVFCEVADFA